MNPVLTGLAVFSLLAMAASGRRRHGVLRAGAVVGLAATALLWPTWRIADGIPSPSASLQGVAPWVEARPFDPTAGNPELVDVSAQIEPGLLFQREELRAGRMPWWNPFQFAGAPFFANGQSGVLFPLHLLFAVLPLELGFVLLPWLRLFVGGLGAWALARAVGVSDASSLLAAVAYPLSGRFAAFLLFPMGNALALVPWLLLATERLAAGGPDASTGPRAGAFRPPWWVTLALLAALQLLAGHPETAVFTGMVTALYLLVRGGARLATAWCGFLGGWVGGLGLAAVQLVPLTLELVATDRWQGWQPGAPPSWAQRGMVAVRILFPEAFGSARDGTWWGPFLWVPTSLYLGALVLPLALAGAAGWRRDRRLCGLVVVAAVTVAATLALPGVRHLLLAMPVVQRGLHHYFAFAIMLSLGVLAARGLDRWVDEGWWAVRHGVVLQLVAVGVVWRALAVAWQEHATSGAGTLGALLAITGALSLGLMALARPARRRVAAGVVVLLTAIDLARVHGPINPGLSLAALYPRPPVVDFLAANDGRFAATGHVLRPNAATAYRLRDVRGHDVLEPLLYRRTVTRQWSATADPFFAPLVRWDSPWLDRLAVRLVVTGPGSDPPIAGWRLVYSGRDGRVWERPAVPPLVRTAGSCRLHGLPLAVPGRWSIELAGRGPCRVEVAEGFAAGWRGRHAGRPVEITTADGILLQVELDADSSTGVSRLELHYVPAGLGWGLLSSGLAAVALAVAIWIARRRRAAASTRGRS